MANDDDTLRQIGQLGHELRNALTSVLAAAEVFGSRCPDSATEHDVITRQVGRMRKLVDEMFLLTARK